MYLNFEKNTYMQREDRNSRIHVALSSHFITWQLEFQAINVIFTLMFITDIFILDIL